MATVEANGVTLGIEEFGDAAEPLVLCAGGPTMLSWPDEVCEAVAAADVTSSGTTFATRVRRSPSTLRLRRTRCATLPPTRQRSPASSTTGPRT